eukprot:403375610
MGMNNNELKTYKDRNEHKLEDKQVKTEAEKAEDKLKQAKEEYDFENAQIEDLGNFIIKGTTEDDGVGGGQVNALGGQEEQDKLMSILQKRIAKLDEELEQQTKKDQEKQTDVVNDGGKVYVVGGGNAGVIAYDEDVVDGTKEKKMPVFIKKRDRKTIDKKQEQQEKDDKQCNPLNYKNEIGKKNNNSKVLLSFDDEEEF